MDDSPESQGFSDDYSSFSDETSDLLESASMGHSWSNTTRLSNSHLPPHTNVSVQTLHSPQPRCQPPSPTTYSAPASRAGQIHRDLPSTNRLPEAHPAPHHPHLPREPAHFGLPNFPLPTANRDSHSLPYAGGIDPPTPLLDLQGWSDWENGRISPLTRPASRISWPSEDDSWGDFPFSQSAFVDLTGTNSPPDMPSGSKRRATTLRTATAAAADGPNKRRKLGAGVDKESAVKDEGSEVEALDLREVDDDDGLSKALQKQQEMAIKAQRKEESDKPLKMSSLQCIICLEPMKDVTVTHCGHIFCHSCLMEALIAGEQQEAEPGKFNSKCPVCRKKVSRPKPGSKKLETIPLEMKFTTRSKLATKKLNVSITD